MRAIAGAIVVLAGAIIIAAVVNGAALTYAAGRTPVAITTVGGDAGGLRIGLGAVLAIAGLRDRSGRRRDPTPSSFFEQTVA